MSKKYEIFVENKPEKKTDKRRKDPSQLSPLTIAHREYYRNKSQLITSIPADRDVWFKAKAIARIKGEYISKIIENSLREYIDKNKDILDVLMNLKEKGRVK